MPAASSAGGPLQLALRLLHLDTQHAFGHICVADVDTNSGRIIELLGEEDEGARILVREQLSQLCAETLKMRFLIIVPAVWGFTQPPATLGRLATPYVSRGEHVLLKSKQDAQRSVGGKRENAVPSLDTEKWLADVEGTSEPSELDTVYWLEAVDAEATLKADADAETTLLLTLSAGASTTFATAWQFALPLALLESGGPQAAATLMAATTGAKVLFAPSVGRLADKAPRVDAARAARAAQAGGVGLSCLALPHLADETSWLPLLLAGSAIEALGAVVTKGAPRKDWAPTLLDGDALRKATVSLSNAALLGELAGPALGAFVLGASGAPTVGAAAVAGELAAQAALERLSARAPYALSAPKGETTKAAPAWAAFFGQPSGAAITTVAFALLWFTALTPHTPVLLAALADRGAPAESLAAFRAAGALAGAGGVALYAAAADGRTETRRAQTTTTSEARRLATRDVAALVSEADPEHALRTAATAVARTVTDLNDLFLDGAFAASVAEILRNASSHTGSEAIELDCAVATDEVRSEACDWTRDAVRQARERASDVLRPERVSDISSLLGKNVARPAKYNASSRIAHK